MKNVRSSSRGASAAKTPGVLALALCSALSMPLMAGSGPGGGADGPLRYIVEFEELPVALFRGDLAGKDPELSRLKATSPATTGARRLSMDAPEVGKYRALLSARRDSRLADFRQTLGRDLETLHAYEVVFNGVALTLTDSEAASLRGRPGVKSVRRDEVAWPVTDTGPIWIGADQLWGAGGYTGQGVVVGVIDTGIRSTHVSFAHAGISNPRGRTYGLCTTGAATCNNKVIGIYDFSTGDESTEANNGQDIDGHGTHVASTVAGVAVNFRLSTATGNVNRTMRGVAPGANLISYKACEEDVGCYGSWTKAALEQSVIDGVDVINYSIGGSAVDPWTNSNATAMLAAREAGVTVIVAAGNDGPGDATVTAPSNAPWVMSVAAASHGRGIANDLQLSGPAPLPGNAGLLVGLGNTVGTNGVSYPIVVPDDFPLCGTGSDPEGDAPTGASKPPGWGANHFTGEIVVCQRGFYAGVAKSNNVRLAGAAGMILVNTAQEGASVAEDAHSLPATHLNYADGQALLAWLSSGTGHVGALGGARLATLPSFGNILASFSGRGPNIAAGIDLKGVVKPDITAPGVSIFAAGSGADNALVGMGGTSMASPHIAGAAALLLSVKPQWTVDQVVSALQLTANPVVMDSNGVETASSFGQGSGLARVGQAAKAGLYLATSAAAFRQANPVSGGAPAALNLPSIGHSACFERCTVQRVVTDMAGGGQWTVRTEMGSGGAITVSPSTFTLASGASQALDIAIDVDSPALAGQWVHGAVVLTPSTAGAPALRLPVAVYATPGAVLEAVALSGPATEGRERVSLGGLVAFPKADYRATALVPVRSERLSLLTDPTPSDPFNSDAGAASTATRWIEIPPVASCGQSETWQISAGTQSLTSQDVDLYVGEDFSANGRAEEDEVYCESRGPDASERCAFSLKNTSCSAPRQLWVHVQNWQGSGGTDFITLDTLAVSENPDRVVDGGGSLQVVGPAAVARYGEHVLDLQYDVPGLASGGRAVGFVELRADRDSDQPTARLRVEVSVSESVRLQPGIPETLTLSAGQAHERAFIDVPVNASRLQIELEDGAGVQLYAARAPQGTAALTWIADAPGRAQAQVVSPASGQPLLIEGDVLQPGRWYITPVNTGSAPATFTLTAQLDFESARPALKMGAYYNPARSGAGLQLYELGAAGLWGFTWYTYDASGAPTWYLGVAAKPGANSGYWTSPIKAYRWSQGEAIESLAGDVSVAMESDSSFLFSWTLDGVVGSERMQIIDQLGCPTVSSAPLRVSGHWFSPKLSGFGYSLYVANAVENYVAYLYDSSGSPRWVIADAAPFALGRSLGAKMYMGACPTCSYVTPSSTAAGTLVPTYADGALSNVSLVVNFPQPLSGSWSVNLPTSPVSDRIACP